METPPNLTAVKCLFVYKLATPKYPLVNSLFGAVKVDKKGSTDPWKRYRKTFSMGSQGVARNVVIFGVDNSSSKQ